MIGHDRSARRKTVNVAAEIPTAAQTRFPLADALSDAKARSKDNQKDKGNLIHDTSLIFWRKHQI